MATLRLITEQDFRNSTYGDLADQVPGRLSDLIAQAEAHVESRLDQRLKVEAYVERIRPEGQGRWLLLRNRPVTALTTIERRQDRDAAWEVLDLDGFELHAGGGTVDVLDHEVLGYELRVTYSAGHAEIPWDLKQAVIAKSAMLAYQDLEIFGVGDGKPPGLLYIDDHITALLAPYKQSAR